MGNVLSEATQLKRCSKCGEEKALSEFYRKGQGSAALEGQCKECKVKAARIRRNDPAQAPREAQKRWREAHPGLKRCTKCKEVKPTSEFYRASKERDGLKSCCKACQSEAQKQYAAAYNHAYYLDHGEELRARARDYFHEHVEENRRRARQWAKENPERYHELQRVHRHKKRSNGGSFTAAEWDALCGHFNYLCACCHERRPLTVDHIVPVLLGGGSDISNIQPLCRACNSAKGMSVRDYR